MHPPPCVVPQKVEHTVTHILSHDGDTLYTVGQETCVPGHFKDDPCWTCAG